MRALLLLVLAGCPAKQAPAPCERGARLELRLVDNDSPFMKQAYAKVLPDKSGASTEPAAIAANVRADIDMWRANRSSGENELPREPAPRQIDYFLLAVDRAALTGYLPKLGTLPDDRELRIQHVPSLHSDVTTVPFFRTYYVVKQPLLETKHVAEIHVREDRVDLDLTSEGKALFATATEDAAKTGKKIATLVDGDVVSAPIVESAIKAGRFSIPTTDPAALGKQLACVTAPRP